MSTSILLINHSSHQAVLPVSKSLCLDEIAYNVFGEQKQLLPYMGRKKAFGFGTREAAHKKYAFRVQLIRYVEE